jgi:diguanylate cyclase (GGDEF)-like protein/PAS domain S-box-containing protein
MRNHLSTGIADWPLARVLQPASRSVLSMKTSEGASNCYPLDEGDPGMASELTDTILPEVQQNANALQAALSAMPVGVSWAQLADQRIVFMNRKFTEIFGYVLADFPFISDWNASVYPFAEDQASIARTWVQYIEAEGDSNLAIDPLEVRIRCKSGEIKTVILSGVILHETGWVLATFVDITDRKRDELLIQEAVRQAHENQAIYRLLLDHSPEMIVLSPFDESRRYVTPAVEQITGFTAEEYLAIPPLEMVHPEEREPIARKIEDLGKGNLSQVLRYRTLRKNGGFCWVEAYVTGYLDPRSKRAGGYVATIRDISEERKREARRDFDIQQLSRVAALDELTGIANRRAFNRAIKGEARRHTRSTRDLSLLLIDVDHFKAYNDLYGHLPGDVCLKKIAATLKQTLRRDPDLAARFGGEEFVVLMPMTEISGAEAVALKIVHAVAALALPHAGSPFGIVTVSAGIASWPSGVPLDPNLLIEKADRALYRAKQRGRNAYELG